MPTNHLTLSSALVRDHDAEIPSEQDVNHAVLVTTRQLFASAPGKRRAAIAAAWNAATDTEGGPDGGDLRHAFATYRQVEHELRAQLRIAIARVAATEPESKSQRELARMLHRLASFEALATWIPARTEGIKHRHSRRRR